jgi:hypothetical protein
MVCVVAISLLEVDDKALVVVTGLGDEEDAKCVVGVCCRRVPWLLRFRTGVARWP